MRNHSNENEFDLHENGRTGETHFHMNGFAQRLLLTQRKMVTRKRTICLRRVDALTPSDWTFQLSALIFSPIAESLVAIIIRSRTPEEINRFFSLNNGCNLDVNYQTLRY